MATKMFTVLVLGGSVLLQFAAPALAVPFHSAPGNLTNTTATALITRPIPTRMPILPHFLKKVEEPIELRGEILDTIKCFPSKPDPKADPNEDSTPADFLDSHKENALWAADHFCKTQARKYDGAKAPIGLISHTYDTRKALGQDDTVISVFTAPSLAMMDHWQVNVTDTEKCNLGLVKERYMQRPTNQYDCKALLFATYRQCNNKGRGGSVKAGCIKFSMHPLW